MQDLIAFLETNLALVLSNRPHLRFAFLSGGGGFLVGRYLLTERVANLESRIARRDEEITGLKAKREAPESEPAMVPIFGTTLV
ncbi:hypothetical protein [Mesorhizobium sp. M0207]|uniref:hypothetical protein n=1 Tax=Mesorhizobium sp. M0207 TaxID=2956915 RepID=UPI00333D1931